MRRVELWADRFLAFALGMTTGVLASMVVLAIWGPV